MAEDRSQKEVSAVVSIGGSDVAVTLRLKATKPSEKDGKWLSTIIAYLSRDRRRPIPNQPLFLHRNGAEVGLTPKTRTQGEFSCDVELPGPGEYVLTVGVPDTEFWAAVTVTVPSESKATAIPQKLHVSVTGKRGRYRFTIGVSANDGRFIPKSPILVVRDSVKATVFTGDDGLFIYDVRGPVRVVIIGGNTPDLKWDGVLPGPKPRQAF